MQTDFPQNNIETVLKNAFSYWSRTIPFQILFSLVYFSILFLLNWKLVNYFGLAEEMTRLAEVFRKDPAAFGEAARQFSQKPELKSFTLAAIVAKALLFPLNIGFFNIFRKLDEGQKLQLEDLFAGYMGRNFFIFFGYYLFWGIIAMYANSLVLPGIFWVVITLFCAPLMFFANKSIAESIRLGIAGIRLKPSLVLVGCIVGFLFSYSGVLLVFALALTYPFWNAMIYAMYQDIFSEKK